MKPGEVLTAEARGGFVPTAAGLRVWLPLLEQKDAHPDWPAHVRATLADVARRLGHGL
jgi:hypothetical protein